MHPHERDADPGRVRPMSKSDLARVLRWRNHPEVRRHMYTRHEITPDEHRHWFARASVDSTCVPLIFELAGTPAGFVAFSGVAVGGVASWGFYLAPEAPRGTGRALGRAALAHGFEHLRLHKVCGEALALNERSIRFHARLGFVREGVLREQHFDGERHHTVVRFGLLHREWRAAR